MFNTRNSAKRVRCACEPCRKGKLGCDHARPCSKCRHRGIEDQCMDRNQSAEISMDQYLPPPPELIQEDSSMSRVTDEEPVMMYYESSSALPDMILISRILSSPMAVLDYDPSVALHTLNSSLTDEQYQAGIQHRNYTRLHY